MDRRRDAPYYSDVPSGVDGRNPNPDDAPGVSLLEALVALLLIVLVLGALAWPWLSVADRALAIPVEASSESGTLAHFADHAKAADSLLVTWVLAWGAKAAWTQPWNLFDGNVLYPLPGALRGSTPLLSYALLSGPIFKVTHNAVLTANLVSFATFVLAAWLFYLLARRVGLSIAASTVGAIAFAFGPLRLPTDVHVVQYANFQLPLLALAFLSVHHHHLKVFGATLFGLFSSFYIAACVLPLLAVEILLRLVKYDLARAIRSAAAAVPAVVLLGVFAYAFFPAQPAQETFTVDPTAGQLVQAHAFLPGGPGVGFGTVVVLLALIGLARARAPSQHSRTGL